MIYFLVRTYTHKFLETTECMEKATKSIDTQYAHLMTTNGGIVKVRTAPSQPSFHPKVRLTKRLVDRGKMKLS